MTMRKFLHIALVALAMLAGAHRISSVESNGAWVYLYDDTRPTVRCSRLGEP
jgi:VCBS repeat-containing protein